MAEPIPRLMSVPVRGRREMTVLDDIDRRLLRALWVDGRARGCVLARDLGLSDSAVSVRLRRLCDSGALTGVHADVDPAALGREIQAIVRIRLVRHVTSQAYEERLRAMPSVLSATVLVGEFDLDVRLACRDLPDLELTVGALRDAGAETTHTQLVARPVTGLGQALLSEETTP
jgi:DNA-binding Lrp family transcriptional regulator